MSEILILSDILIEFNKRDIFENIKKLPDDIKRYIYYEFFDTLYHFEKFNLLLNNRLSMKLDISLIRPYIPIILSKQKLIKYFSENIIGDSNHKVFKTVYTQYKINNKKNFSNMINGDSFSLSMLMYLYH